MRNARRTLILRAVPLVMVIREAPWSLGRIPHPPYQGCAPGLAKSTKTETSGPSNRIGFQGILKKLLMLGLVFAAALVDLAMGARTYVVRDAANWSYLANEGLSILENMTLAGSLSRSVSKTFWGTLKRSIVLVRTLGLIKMDNDIHTIAVQT